MQKKKYRTGHFWEDKAANAIFRRHPKNIIRISQRNTFYTHMGIKINAISNVKVTNHIYSHVDLVFICK